MAKVKIQGNAAGSGVFTVTAPISNTNRTLTLPDTTGTLLDENSSVPAANLTGTVADARFPSTLPAISGASLTNLPADATKLPLAGGTLTGALTINSTGNTPMVVRSTYSTGGYAELQLGASGATIGYLGSAEALVSGGAAADLSIRSQSNLVFSTSGNSERMRIDSAGNVGIGGTASSKLHVEHNSVTNAHYDSARSAVFEKIENVIQIVASDGGGNAGGIVLTNAPSSGNNKHWVIHHSGTSTNDQFEIGYLTSTGTDFDGRGMTPALTITTDGKASFSKGVTPAQIESAASFELLYGGSSDSGIAMATTANGNASGFISFRRSTTTQIGHISRNGSSDSVAYSTSSDYRLKENESEIDDGITRIKQLKPYKFNWKSDATNTEQDGFFAHEVESVVPHAIVGEKDAVRTLDKVVVNNEDDIIAFDIEEADWTTGKSEGTYPSDTTWEASKEQIVPQTMDYGQVTPLLAAALKEAITKIETLEARITAGGL